MGRFRFILGNLIDRCNAAVDIIGDGRALTPPEFGFSFEPSLNAKSIGVPTTLLAAILVNQGFITFATTIGKICIEALIKDKSENGATFALDDDSIADSIRKKPSLVLRFAATLGSYALDGTGRNVPYFPGEIGTLEALICFIDSIELFVVAHEVCTCLPRASTS